MQRTGPKLGLILFLFGWAFKCVPHVAGAWYIVISSMYVDSREGSALGGPWFGSCTRGQRLKEAEQHFDVLACHVLSGRAPTISVCGLGSELLIESLVDLSQ